MKVKNIIITVLFSLIIIGMFVFNVVKEDIDISLSERRKLAQFPELTKENILSSELSNKFESYAVDQIIFRESFRNLKSFVNIKLFGQKDDNSYFEKDGAIYKIEYPLNESNVNKTTDILKNVIDIGTWILKIIDFIIDNRITSSGLFVIFSMLTTRGIVSNIEKNG